MALPGNSQQKSTSPPTPAQTAAGIKDALTDRSQHIRTMAKDLAALATAGQPNIPAPEQPAKTPTPSASRHETISGVTTEVAEQPFFERQLPRHEREVAQPEELPSMAEASTIVQSGPLPQEADSDVQRSEVLERLRSRVEETAHMSLSDGTPEKETANQEPAWPDIPTPPAQFAPPAPDSDGPAPFIPVARPATPGVPQPQKAPSAAAQPVFPQAAGQGSDRYREPVDDTPASIAVVQTPAAPQSGLQTYAGDFADHITASGASAFSVLAAEQDAQPGTAPKPERRAATPRALIAIATGVLLLGLAGGGMFLVYQTVMTMRATPIAGLTVPTVVFPDGFRQISGTGPELVSSLATSINEPLLSGKVLVTFILTSMTGEDQSIVQTPAGGGRLFLSMLLPAPDMLLRNIREEGSVGILNIDGESRPFFVLRVDSYERTFAGMLTWEPLLLRDLASLYPLHPVAPTETEAPVSLDTATTSNEEVSTTTPVSLPPRLTPAPARTRFEDEIVANRDVRVLRDVDGKALVLYGYADKQTLIIARNEAAFSLLLSRLKEE